jgi:NAD(P)-dependent dehydrogenase (short-subunit alcohol dehydrogenase family)
MGRLDNTVAIITGASSGIGLAVAERFVAEGALVVLAARRAGLGAEIVARLGPQRASFVATDVTDGGRWRSGEPVAGSTITTSAPRSANSLLA